MVSSKRFTYNADKKWLIAEMSDFKGQPNVFCNAYPDSADVGIWVLSERTGKEVLFVEDEQKRDAEGDLQVTIFRPSKQSLKKVPGCKGMELHLLND